MDEMKAGIVKGMQSGYLYRGDRPLAHIAIDMDNTGIFILPAQFNLLS